MAIGLNKQPLMPGWWISMNFHSVWLQTRNPVNLLPRAPDQSKQEDSVKNRSSVASRIVRPFEMNPLWWRGKRYNMLKCLLQNGSRTLKCCQDFPIARRQTKWSWKRFVPVPLPGSSIPPRHSVGGAQKRPLKKPEKKGHPLKLTINNLEK